MKRSKFHRNCAANEPVEIGKFMAAIDCPKVLVRPQDLMRHILNNAAQIAGQIEARKEGMPANKVTKVVKVFFNASFQRRLVYADERVNHEIR